MMKINDILNDIYKLPSTSLEALIHSVSEVEYPKCFHLLRENGKESKSYFIKKGIVRAYAHKNKKEVTLWLGQEGDLILPLQIPFTGLGEYAKIELLEDSILYEIDLKRLQDLYLTDIHIANWGRKFAEYTYLKSETFFIARRFKTPAERYKELITECPDIIQRVPLGIVASYLGISQVSLNRLSELQNK